MRTEEDLFKRFPFPPHIGGLPSMSEWLDSKGYWHSCSMWVWYLDDCEDWEASDHSDA